LKQIPKEYQYVIEKAKSLGSYKTKKQKETIHRFIELLIKMQKALKELTEPGKNPEIHLHLHIHKK